MAFSFVLEALERTKIGRRNILCHEKNRSCFLREKKMKHSPDTQFLFLGLSKAALTQ